MSRNRKKSSGSAPSNEVNLRRSTRKRRTSTTSKPSTKPPGPRASDFVGAGLQSNWNPSNLVNPPTWNPPSGLSSNWNPYNWAPNTGWQLPQGGSGPVRSGSYVDFFSFLPDEIIENIFVALHPKGRFIIPEYPNHCDAFTLRSVCSRFDAIGSSVIFHTVRFSTKGCAIPAKESRGHLPEGHYETILDARWSWKALAVIFCKNTTRSYNMCQMVREVEYHVDADNPQRDRGNSRLDRMSEIVTAGISSCYPQPYGPLANDNEIGYDYDSDSGDDAGEAWESAFASGKPLDHRIFADCLLRFRQLRRITVSTFPDELTFPLRYRFGIYRRSQAEDPLPNWPKSTKWYWDFEPHWEPTCEKATDLDQGFGFGTMAEQLADMHTSKDPSCRRYLEAGHAYANFAVFIALHFRNSVLGRPAHNKRSAADEQDDKAVMTRLDDLRLLMWPAELMRSSTDTISHCTEALNQIKHFTCLIDNKMPNFHVWEFFRPYVLYPMRDRLETLRIGFHRFFSRTAVFSPEAEHSNWLYSPSYNEGIEPFHSEEKLFSRPWPHGGFCRRDYHWYWVDRTLPLHLLLAPLQSPDEIVPIEVGSEQNWSQASEAEDVDDPDVSEAFRVEETSSTPMATYDINKSQAILARRFDRAHARRPQTEVTARPFDHFRARLGHWEAHPKPDVPTFSKLQRLHVRPWQDLKEKEFFDLIARHRFPGSGLRHVRVEAMCMSRINGDMTRDDGDWNNFFERINLATRRGPHPPDTVFDGVDLYRDSIFVDKGQIPVMHAEKRELIKIKILYKPYTRYRPEFKVPKRQPWETPQPGDDEDEESPEPPETEPWVYETRWHRWPAESDEPLRARPMPLFDQTRPNTYRPTWELNVTHDDQGPLFPPSFISPRTPPPPPLPPSLLPPVVEEPEMDIDMEDLWLIE
ncbi:MAG: hypothetical protein M1833_000807 [Piccolia ochrophora]|nr:MAG: hypothetical protein M1833_000807 [Piccolia ochrophora]